MSEVQIGTVAHYFDHIGVAAIEISEGELCTGDTIHIKGHTTDFTTTVASMQIEHEQVEKAKPGDAVGIKTDEKARQHDKVFKVTE